MTKVITKRKKRQNLCEFTWAGKGTCLDCLDEPLKYEFIPCPEESVNFDTTENLFFECDNLDALKYLQNTHSQKVKCIYIDPPYNTGKSRQYKDNFGDITGCKHSDWLSMMYPRLYLARDLLRDDGVIFISIDDNEVHNLRKICDEIFGEENFIAQIIIKSNPGGRDYGGIAITHEYIICYGKSETELNLVLDNEKKFTYKDDIGRFNVRELRNRNIKFNKWNRPNLCYPFYVDTNNRDENDLYKISLEKKDGFIEIMPLISQSVQTVWRWGREKSLRNLNVNIKAKLKNDGTFMIVEKYRNPYKRERSIWDETSVRNEMGSLAIKELFGEKPFDYPKNLETIKRITSLGSNYDNNDIVLDFFSGSATTAHATMQLNAEDGGNRKFILCQTPDPMDGEYSTIADFCKERMRRAGKKVLEEAKHKAIDVGFQVWKVIKKGDANE